MADDVSRELLERVRIGDEQAAQELYDRYVHRLLALARQRMSHKLRRRVDAEDVVQSACRSFFVRAQHGRFTVKQSGDLWRLLVAITLNKLRMQAKLHRRKKRAMGREESVCAGSCYGLAPERIADEPTPDEAAALAEEIELLMADLKPVEREILQLRLQAYTIDEIAEQVGRSERTVRRLLERLRGRYENEARQLA